MRPFGVRLDALPWRSLRSGSSSVSTVLLLSAGEALRLSLAPVCMTKCMAAPSQAFAHSLGSLLRGAQSAISRDVLVPQANSSSMVPSDEEDEARPRRTRPPPAGTGR